MSTYYVDVKETERLKEVIDSYAHKLELANTQIIVLTEEIIRLKNAGSTK